MAGLLKTYDPSKIDIVFNGININSGVAPDTFISVSRNEDTWTLVVGSDGTGARTKNSNISGTVEITLMQNSPVNALLAASALTDENSDANIISNLTINDPSGSLILSAVDCWIRKVADQDLGKEQNTRTWMFEAHKLLLAPGLGA